MTYELITPPPAYVSTYVEIATSSSNLAVGLRDIAYIVGFCGLIFAFWVGYRIVWDFLT